MVNTTKFTVIFLYNANFKKYVFQFVNNLYIPSQINNIYRKIQLQEQIFLIFTIFKYYGSYNLNLKKYFE